MTKSLSSFLVLKYKLRSGRCDFFLVIYGHFVSKGVLCIFQFLFKNRQNLLIDTTIILESLRIFLCFDSRKITCINAWMCKWIANMHVYTLCVPGFLRIFKKIILVVIYYPIKKRKEKIIAHKIAAPRMCSDLTQLWRGFLSIFTKEMILSNKGKYFGSNRPKGVFLAATSSSRINNVTLSASKSDKGLVS